MLAGKTPLKFQFELNFMSLATKHILINVGYVLAFIKTWPISFVSESSDTKQLRQQLFPDI